MEIAELKNLLKAGEWIDTEFKEARNAVLESRGCIRRRFTPV